jgi:bifunctional DNA-binding transcriptional regulator/antitoxin component of YhaV-PrlF toxin-antitoxin module
MRSTGAYLMIPKDTMKSMGIGPGNVVEVSVTGVETKDGTYTISNTIQVDGGFYLRKLDLRIIGDQTLSWLSVYLKVVSRRPKVIYTRVYIY